jgi:hypothetical protein
MEWNHAAFFHVPLGITTILLNLLQAASTSPAQSKSFFPIVKALRLRLRLRFSSKIVLEKPV